MITTVVRFSPFQLCRRRQNEKNKDFKRNQTDNAPTEIEQAITELITEQA